MAVAPILPQSASHAGPALDAVADALKQTLAADQSYVLPFCRAVDRALQYVHEGIAFEPYNATHYRVQSHSRRWLFHYATLHRCSCGSSALWCWHLALMHLLTAHAALRQLDRCPRPFLASCPVRKGHDLLTIVREADEV